MPFVPVEDTPQAPPPSRFVPEPEAPQPEESTFRKLAVGGAQGLDVLRQAFTPGYREASQAITDIPKERERISKILEPLFPSGGLIPSPANALADMAATGRAGFSQFGAIMPKGFNDAMGTASKYLSEYVTAPAMKALIPVHYAYDEKQKRYVQDNTTRDKLIDEFAPDITMLGLFHAGGTLMNPNAAPLFDRSRGTMAPEQQPLPQQPQTPPPATAIPAAAGRAGATPAAAPPMSVAERAAQLEASNAEIRARLAQQAQPEAQAAPAPVAPTDVAQPVTAQPPPVPPAPMAPHPMDDLRFQVEEPQAGKTVYHGGGSLDLGKLTAEGFSVSLDKEEAAGYQYLRGRGVEQYTMPAGAKIANAIDIANDINQTKGKSMSQISLDMEGKPFHVLLDQVARRAKASGYDAIDMTGIEGRSQELRILNPAILTKTASLTEPLPEGMSFPDQPQAALTKTAEPTAEAPPINKFDTPESRAAHIEAGNWTAQTAGKIREINAMAPEEKTAAINALPPEQKAWFETPAEGERGSIRLPTGPEMAERWHNFTRPVRMWRDTIAHMLDPGVRETRRAMMVGKDAGITEANLTGNEVANDVRGPVRRTFGKKNQDVANEALSLVIESHQDPQVRQLTRDLDTATQAGNQQQIAQVTQDLGRAIEDHITTGWQKILNSPDSLSSWQRKAGESYPYALVHWQELHPIARLYNALTDQERLAENTGGIPTPYRSGYVMHKHDIPETPGGAGYLTGAHGDVPSSFIHLRTLDTFADMIAAGLDPGTMNASDLLQSRVARGQRIINGRAWQESLKNMTDPRSGDPIVSEMVKTPRPDGTIDETVPDGYGLEKVGFQPVVVKNGYEGLFSALTDPSWFEKYGLTRGFMNAVGTGKSLALMLDTFHLGRVAWWSGWLKATNIENPFGYRRGLTLLDYSPQEIANMAAHGEIPQDWTQNLQYELYKRRGLVSEGFQVGRISDAMHQEWIRKIPGIGDVNRFIFDQYQRGAMMEVGSMEFDRLKHTNPNLSDQQIFRYVSRSLNRRFGNLGSQGWVKSKTGQDIARSFVLAPQWNNGLFMSEMGGIKETGARALDLVTARAGYGSILGRSVFGMAVGTFAMNQLINLYTRGIPTWENPEEGWGAKMSAWIPDIGGRIMGNEGPGFFNHPLGLAAETMHLLMTGYSRTGDFYETLKGYLRSRSGTAMRPIMTWATNEDMFGRTLKPGTVWGEAAKSVIPMPIGLQAYGSAAMKASGIGETPIGKTLGIGGGQSFLGQYQKQAMGSVGWKVEGASSPEQRINSLAKEFNKQAGKEPQGRFFAGDYEALTNALRVGNKLEASNALDTLLKTKGSDAIIKHYQSWPTHPFTGNSTLEDRFARSLNFEQRRQYQLARDKRAAIADQAIRQVSQMARRAGNQ